MKKISDMSIRYRISMGFALIALIALIIGLSSMFSLNEILGKMEETNSSISTNIQNQVSQSALIGNARVYIDKISNSKTDSEIESLGKTITKDIQLDEQNKKLLLNLWSSKLNQLSSDLDFQSNANDMDSEIQKIITMSNVLSEKTVASVMSNLEEIANKFQVTFNNNKSMIEKGFNDINTTVSENAVGNIKSAFKIYAYTFDYSSTVKDLLLDNDKHSITYTIVRINTLVNNANNELKYLSKTNDVSKIIKSFENLQNISAKMSEVKLKYLETPEDKSLKNEIDTLKKQIITETQNINKEVLGAIDNIEFDATIKVSDTLDNIKSNINKGNKNIEDNFKEISIKIRNGLTEVKASSTVAVSCVKLNRQITLISASKFKNEIEEHQQFVPQIIAELTKELNRLSESTDKTNMIKGIEILAKHMEDLCKAKLSLIEIQDNLVSDTGKINNNMDKLSQASMASAGKLKNSVNENMMSSKQKVKQWQMIQIFLVSIAIAISAIIGYFVVHSIVKPINTAVNAMQEIAQGEGDLTKRLSVTTQDEVGQLAHWFNQFTVKVHETVKNFAHTVNALNTESKSLETMALELKMSSAKTAQDSSEIMVSSKKVNDSVKSAATGVEDISSALQNIFTDSQKAGETTKSAVEFSKAAENLMANLTVKSKGIGSVVAVIDRISEQINLLSLNATIEAARAGDAGKGFTVVANEIKNLANETVKSTENIKSEIVGIQTETKNALKSIENILKYINEINSLTSSINNSVEVQNANANSINQSVGTAANNSDEIAIKISQITADITRTSENAHGTSNCSDKLAEISKSLQNIVDQFKY